MNALQVGDVRINSLNRRDKQDLEEERASENQNTDTDLNRDR